MLYIILQSSEGAKGSRKQRISHLHGQKANKLVGNMELCSSLWNCFLCAVHRFPALLQEKVKEISSAKLSN